MSMRAALIAAVTLVGMASCGRAQMVYYYDPDTGNVSFDTAGAPSGEVWGYGLGLNPFRLDEVPENLRFRPENFVNLFSSTFASATPLSIEQASTSDEVSGYFTIGDVLPPGLDEAVWKSVFSTPNLGFFPSGNPNSVVGRHIYFDRAIPTTHTPPATLVYGQPDRPFDNRWDLVDPDELNWATSAQLVYDPLTGEVVINTLGPAGGHISYWAIESDGAFLADNFTPWIDVPFTTANADVIGLAADAIEPGQYRIGAILPAGLSLDEVRTAFTSARFMGRAGFGGESFDIAAEGADFAFAMAIPEPTTTLLAAIALTAAGFGRRLG